jgi:DNA invertase Pin-like site-specific DNA recombinase
MTPDVTPDLVAYYRVSTKQQGESGLGLEAQQAAVAAHVRMTGSTLRSAYTEIETGKHANRPQLTGALAHCRASGAILVIAKLDRLARNVAFLSALMDGDVEFRALDLPGASRLVLHIMAAIAENEAKAISDRTKAALQAAKARGTVLGRPANLTDASRRKSIESRQAVVAKRNELTIPLIRAWRKAHWTLQRIADELTRLGVPLPRGGSVWRHSQVRRVLTVARTWPRRRRHARRARPAC